MKMTGAYTRPNGVKSQKVSVFSAGVPVCAGGVGVIHPGGSGSGVDLHPPHDDSAGEMLAAPGNSEESGAG